MLLQITIIVTLACVAFLFTSQTHIRKQKRILEKELKIDDSYQQQFSKMTGIDGAAAIGTTAFDVLYNTAKLDPSTLQGIDHLHHDREFNSIGELMEYIKNDIVGSSKPESDSWNRIIHKYKGYTGEQRIFENIEGDGQSAEVPLSGTESGHDVIVDGKLYNVKITDDPKYIQKHLDGHPDIDVITNREMADSFPDNPRVIVDDSISVGDMFNTTEETIEGLVNYGELFDKIPLITLAINTAKNGMRIKRGEINIKSGVEFTVTDTAGSGVGGLAGAEAGAAIGMALAPVTGGASLVIAPLAGVIVGVMGGKSIASYVKERHLRKFKKALEEQCSAYAQAFLKSYSKIIFKCTSFYDGRLNSAEAEIKKEKTFKRLFFPNINTVFWKMFKKNIKTENYQVVSDYHKLYESVESAKNKSVAGANLFAQGIEILQGVEPAISAYQSVTQASAAVESEKNRVYSKPNNKNDTTT